MAVQAVIPLNREDRPRHDLRKIARAIHGRSVQWLQGAAWLKPAYPDRVRDLRQADMRPRVKQGAARLVSISDGLRLPWPRSKRLIGRRRSDGKLPARSFWILNKRRIASCVLVME